MKYFLLFIFVFFLSLFSQAQVISDFNSNSYHVNIQSTVQDPKDSAAEINKIFEEDDKLGEIRKQYVNLQQQQERIRFFYIMVPLCIIGAIVILVVLRKRRNQ
jgi:hypothetical protein